MVTVNINYTFFLLPGWRFATDRAWRHSLLLRRVPVSSWWYLIFSSRSIVRAMELEFSLITVLFWTWAWLIDLCTWPREVQYKLTPTWRPLDQWPHTDTWFSKDHPSTNSFMALQFRDELSFSSLSNSSHDCWVLTLLYCNGPAHFLNTPTHSWLLILILMAGNVPTAWLVLTLAPTY